MVFLELRRDSRVTTGNSGCLLCWPRQVQSSIRVAKERHPCMWGRQPRSWSWNPSAPLPRGRGGIPVSSDSHGIPTLSVQRLVVYLLPGEKRKKKGRKRKFHYKLLIKAQASSLPSTFPSLLPSFFLFFFISQVERPRECKQRIS